MSEPKHNPDLPVIEIPNGWSPTSDYAPAGGFRYGQKIRYLDSGREYVWMHRGWARLSDV